jgi:branched-chain amino acid transport system permease protein
VLTNKVSVPKRKGLWTFLALGAVIVLLMGLRMNALEYYGPARGLQDLFNALTLGSLYALIALGYTMVYGIIRLINFAHGEIFMLGAFFAFYAMLLTPAGWLLGVLVALFLAALVYGLLRPARGASTPVKGGVAAAVFAFGALYLSLRGLGWLEATAVSMLLTATCGVFLYAIAYRPLWGAPRTSFLITAIAASFFLQNMGQLVFGPQVKGFRPETILTQPLTLSIAGETVYFSGILLFVPVLTGALLLLLHAFVTRKIDTVAVSCVLIAYNWDKNTDRYQRISRFIEAFFPRITDFQKPPRHPKWKEANLAAVVPGWQRHEAAEEWLAKHRVPAVSNERQQFDA